MKMFEGVKKAYAKNHWPFWMAGVAVFSIALTMIIGSEGPADASPTSITSVDTYIPEGYILIEIQVQNYEFLDSILGQFGVIDLYTAPTEVNPRSRPVAQGMKVLRAPLNPQKFSVLAPEDQARTILESGPLVAVLHNPEKAGMKIVNKTKATKRSITVESIE